ncbi:MAG: diguanylate cyclase [Hyphomicrobiales bacterium]
MALISMFFGMIERLNWSHVRRSMLHGLLFGTGAVFSMMTPFELAPGSLFDGRTIFVGLAAAFGGLPAALVSGAFAASFRVYSGGVGMFSGCAGIFFAASIGCFWFRYMRPERGQSNIADLTVLGGILCFSMSAIFLLPPEIALNALKNVVPILAFAILISTVVLGSFMERELRLISSESEWRENAVTDELTGLFNRRKFVDDLETMAQSNQPYAMLIVDIDHFKRVNDEFGHSAGDQALKAMASVIQRNLRSTDSVYRIGGEEFAVLVPNVTQDITQRIASRIGSNVETAKIMHGTVPISLTVSIGIKVAMRATEEPAQVFDQADKAVYAAKQAGRNCIQFASEGHLLRSAA